MLPLFVLNADVLYYYYTLMYDFIYTTTLSQGEGDLSVENLATGSIIYVRCVGKSNYQPNAHFPVITAAVLRRYF